MWVPPSLTDFSTPCPLGLLLECCRGWVGVYVTYDTTEAFYLSLDSFTYSMPGKLLDPSCIKCRNVEIQVAVNHPSASWTNTFNPESLVSALILINLAPSSVTFHPPASHTLRIYSHACSRVLLTHSKSFAITLVCKLFLPGS